MNTDKADFLLIKRYAGNNSKNYNVRLRKENANAELLSLEQGLNLELDRIEPYSDRVVYAHDTHTNIEFDILSKWYLKKAGCIVEFPNFLSSSSYRWSWFTKTTYQIRTSSTSKARDICPIVLKHGEKEVLFKSHSLFRIQGIDTESRTVYLDEVNEADTKIILTDNVFISDEEIRNLLGISEEGQDGIEYSLLDI